MKYVIIGNSAAGIGAVEGLRQVDRDGEITVITDEPHHTYSRPLISYLLLGKTTDRDLKFRGDGFYSENNCALLSGIAVTGVEAGTKQVILADGRRIPFDKLLVATGSSTLAPQIEGLDTVKDRFAFMNLDDARKLDAALDKNKKALIIGAGLIGLKCAEGIVERAAAVTVIDLAPRILSSILDDGGAKMVQEHLESRGLEFRLSSGVTCFKENTAMLSGGDAIDFDLLIMAAGVRPNAGLLAGVAEIDQGIVINGKSETSAPEIYAAGDCTQTLDLSSGRNRVMALLPNAYIQGECAGVNMAGGEKSFDKAIPMNAVGFFGLSIISAGNYSGDVYAENGNGHYKRLFYGDNRLNGYILIGSVEKAGIYTSLIRERTPLDGIDFALVCEKPGLMAFTKEDRMAKLGGEA